MIPKHLTSKHPTLKRLMLGSAFGSALLLAGCATGPGGSSIYVPAAPPPDYDRSEPADASSTSSQDSATPARPSSAREATPREPDPAPRYRDEGDALSGAAASLIARADSLLAQGRTQAAIGQLERAQRISPRSAEVYFKLSEAYVTADNLGAAEQFTLKGLSLAGRNAGLQRSGWLLLADIRRARGNVAGADQAEARASAL
ncbi:tetratricopeptide repeat protein [Marinobacter sp. CA1]|uniref:tetratricopeptide repeat protein n=1 Tax=Marinobacter sp. CA1 TaxID=2817656 RepID=UPI003A5CFD2A